MYVAGPEREDLVEALRESREYARHIEKSRMRLLYANILAFVGIVSGAQFDVLRENVVLKDLVLLAAVALSLYSFLAFQKQTFERKNHLAAAKWAATELGLLQLGHHEEREETSVSESYLGIQLPIPISVSSTLFSGFPAIISATVTGLAGYYLSEPLRLPVPPFLDVSRAAVAIGLGVCMLVGLMLYGRYIARKWKTIREERRPRGGSGVKSVPTADDEETATEVVQGSGVKDSENGA